MNPELSVVIPIYNEQAGLAHLFARLYPALDKLAAEGISYECVFINDGSRDQSARILSDQFRARPDVTRVVLFNGNYGQHMAILAGFQQARGEIVVTLDADLQNPPEEIGALIKKIHEGYDYVGSIRRERQDSLWRTWASRIMNHVRERITHIKITDQGNMLRAYKRNVIDLINQCNEMNTFVPALAYTFSTNPTEIIVEHEERAAGVSNYSLYSLIRLNFDLMTGFSIMPLQLFSMLGIILSASSGVLVILLLFRRFLLGAEAEGVFTLFAFSFFLMGTILFGIGLLGEYIGRIYQQVRGRPRFVVQAVLEQNTEQDQQQNPEKVTDNMTEVTSFNRAVVFAYHSIGVHSIRVLLARGVNIALVVTHNDNPNETIWFESVASLCAEQCIPTLIEPGPQALFNALTNIAPDFIFSFYYRSMLPASLLALAKRGAYNLHGSLLPKYRGRVPVNWAVLHGETETGVTLHVMTEKPDAGAIIAQTAVPILSDDTAHDVFGKLTVAAEQTLWNTIPLLLAGTAPRIANDLSSGSYFGGRTPADGRINWQLPAQQVYNLHRAVAPPYPGAFTDQNGHRFILQQARLGDSPKANLPPGLSVVDNAMFGICGDDHALRINQLLWNGQLITASQLQELLGC